MGKINQSNGTEQVYEAPKCEILHVETETSMLAGSLHGTGEDMGQEEGSWGK